MTFSHYAGTAIVPTLARLVLAAAFISTGWNKVFKYPEFTQQEATELQSLNVTVEPVTTADASSAFETESWRVVATSFRQEANPPVVTLTSPPATADAKPPATTTPTVPTTTTKPAPPSSVGQPLVAGMYRAQGLHKVTLMLAHNNFPYPVWQARLAAFTELIGGAMLLLGLFSRLWGLGLSIAMGVAFYLVSMKMNGIFTMDPRTFAEDIGKFSTAYLQLALFVLAFGVFLTGAGPLSLDRMLFGGEAEAEPGHAKID